MSIGNYGNAARSATAVENSDFAKRVTRLAQIGRIVAIAAGAVTIAGTFWYVQDATHLEFLLRGLAPERPFQLDPARWLPAAAVIVLLSALLVAMLLSVAAVFRHIGAGDFFSRPTQIAFRRMGYLALALSISPILLQAALSLILVPDRPAGTSQILISISGTDVLAMIFAILFFLLAQVLSAAQSAVEENKGFV